MKLLPHISKAQMLRVILTLALSIPCAVAAQTFTTPLRVSTTPSLYDHAPEMHVARDGTIYVTWFTSKATIYISHSTDGGATFSTPIRAVREITTNQYTSLLQRVPEFAIDTKGTLHLVWTEDRMSGQSDVYYIRSSDKGVTWTQPRSLVDSDDSMKYAQDFSAIAIDSSDNVYVAYLDNRDLMRKKDTHYHVRFQKSTDGGATWSNSVVADKVAGKSGSCECCRLDLAVSSSGHVYIAFRSNITVSSTNNQRNIYIARSLNGGVTFDSSIIAQLGGWNIMGCPTTGPHIALDARENLHLSWRDDRSGAPRQTSYYSLLPAGSGLVFGNTKLNSAQSIQANWPDLSIANTGLIASSFLNDATGKLYLTFSSNGGSTWRSPVPVPTEASATIPVIQFDPLNRLYAVWEETTADGGDIYFSRVGDIESTVHLDTILVPPARFDDTSEVVFRWSYPSAFGATPLIWSNIQIGTPSLEMIEFDTRADSVLLGQIAAGTYTYMIRSRNANDTVQLNGSFIVEPTQSKSVPRRTSESAVWPNPVKSRLNMGETGAFTIYDALGRLVLSGETKDTWIDISSLPTGSYTVRTSRGLSKIYALP